MDVHVISKKDNSVHTTITLENEGLGELGSNSVRVKTKLISLTSNNLSYARGGSFLGWWNTYPVPSSLPEPYNDTNDWGIVPAWGFATITKSNIPELAINSTLYGFWPTSAALIDLKLEPWMQKGYFTETSPHRAKLMTVYNRYHVVSEPLPSADELAWRSLFFPVWQTGHLLSQYVFPAPSQSQIPIHPLGMGDAWSKDDANLTSALVISLSASSKTGRSFAWHLSKRANGTGPLGLLQVSSIPDAISNAAETMRLGFPQKSVSYTDLENTISSNWLTDLKAEKIVIFDFGARDGVLEMLADTLYSHPTLMGSRVVILQVGSEQKVYSSTELAESQAAFKKLSKIQVNTSTIRDSILATEAGKHYFEESDRLWNEWSRDRENVCLGMKLVWGEGVKGGDGLEGGWDRLCKGAVGANQGLVYNL